MASHACVLVVEPGRGEEYGRRHDALRPEMRAALRAAGVRNDHVFRHNLTPLGTFECGDLDATGAQRRDNPVNRRWSERMAVMVRADLDPRTGFPFLLPLQRSLD